MLLPASANSIRFIRNPQNSIRIAVCCSPLLFVCLAAIGCSSAYCRISGKRQNHPSETALSTPTASDDRSELPKHPQRIISLAPECHRDSLPPGSAGSSDRRYDPMHLAGSRKAQTQNRRSAESELRSDSGRKTRPRHRLDRGKRPRRRDEAGRPGTSRLCRRSTFRRKDLPVRRRDRAHHRLCRRGAINSSRR